MGVVLHLIERLVGRIKDGIGFSVIAVAEVAPLGWPLGRFLAVIVR